MAKESEEIDGMESCLENMTAERVKEEAAGATRRGRKEERMEAVEEWTAAIVRDFQLVWWELKRFRRINLFTLNRVYFAAQSSYYERPIHLAALTDFWSAARHFSVAGTLVRMGCDRGPGGKGFGNSRPLGKFGACLTGYTLDPFHISHYLDHSVTDSL